MEGCGQANKNWLYDDTHRLSFGSVAFAYALLDVWTCGHHRDFFYDTGLLSNNSDDFFSTHTLNIGGAEAVA